MLTPLRHKLSDIVAGAVLIRPKPSGATTTLAANAAANATTLTLTSATGFHDNDPVLVGSEEDAELVIQDGAPSGADVTLDAPGLKRAHLTGETVREAIAYDLGSVINVRDASAADVSDIETDTARNPTGRLVGHLMFQPQFDLQGWHPTYWALLTGMPLARVLGAGSAADPTQVHTDGTEFGREDSALVLSELLADGSFLRHEFDACSPDYTQLTIAFGQGRATSLPARFHAANYGHHRSAALGCLIDYTLQAKKAAQLETLLEAGLFTVNGSGLSTTLIAETVKDENTFDLAAATGVAAGKWYLVEGGGKQQVLWAHALASLEMTVRTRAAYTFPAGSTVKELTQTPFSGLKEGTTQFRTGGSVRPIRFDNARVQAGVRPGGALFTLDVQPTARTLENLRLRLALPASAISGSSLRPGNLVGTDAPVGWYVSAVRKDTKAALFLGSDCDNGLEQLEMAMGKADLASVSLAFRNQLVSQLMY